MVQALLTCFQTPDEILIVICDSEINEESPAFLNLGDQQPVALYGGFYASAITKEGSVMLINPNFIKNSHTVSLTSFSLPDGKKAVSVASNYDSIAVLSSKGRVFTSLINEESNNIEFKLFEELANIEIVYLSGTYKHYLSLSKDGKVF